MKQRNAGAVLGMASMVMLGHVGLAQAQSVEELQPILVEDSSEQVVEQDSYQNQPSRPATKLELSNRGTPQSLSTITRAKLTCFGEGAKLIIKGRRVK